MTIREAKIEDIKQIQIVRNSVTENTLSNPELLYQCRWLCFGKFLADLVKEVLIDIHKSLCCRYL